MRPRNISIRTFIRENRKALDQAIWRACPGIGTLNDEDRRLWVLNDEGLYLWARAEGVRI